MRINYILIHNLDNEEIVIMDESTGAEITLSISDYEMLLKNGARVLRS